MHVFKYIILSFTCKQASGLFLVLYKSQLIYWVGKSSLNIFFKSSLMIIKKIFVEAKNYF